MNFYIRKIKEEEYPVLEDFLYEAIFVPKDALPPPRDIIKKLELQVYLTDFGKNPGDYGLVAQTGDKIAGAVWVRIMNDYGHIDDNTPSFAISLYKQYRHDEGNASPFKTRGIRAGIPCSPKRKLCCEHV